MVIYQVICYGSYKALSGFGKIHSKKVFRSEEEAINHQEEFKKLCCGGQLMDLSDTAKTKIVELELELKD